MIATIKKNGVLLQISYVLACYTSLFTVKRKAIVLVENNTILANYRHSLRKSQTSGKNCSINKGNIMNNSRVLFLIFLVIGCHSQLLAPYKPIEALLLYVLVATKTTGLTTATILPEQPMFFSSESALQNCLEQSTKLSPWYAQHFIKPPYHPNTIVTTTAHVLGSQKLRASQVRKKLEHVIRTTVFSDVESPAIARPLVLSSTLLSPLTQAVEGCQITPKRYRQKKRR